MHHYITELLNYLQAETRVITLTQTLLTCQSVKAKRQTQEDCSSCSQKPEPVYLSLTCTQQESSLLPPDSAVHVHILIPLILSNTFSPFSICSSSSQILAV